MDPWRNGPASLHPSWLNSLNSVYEQPTSYSRTLSMSIWMEQPWGPPLPNCCQPLHGASGTDCLADSFIIPPTMAQICGWHLRGPATWTKGIGTFHKHLNTQHQNIKFIVEVEENNKLSFLDIQVTRNGTKLNTSVYRKTTHTDRYIPFHSNHHPRTVTRVMRCMRDRANQICDSTSKESELQHLQDVFHANGFPEDLVRKTLSHQSLLPQPPRGTPSPWHRATEDPVSTIC